MKKAFFINYAMFKDAALFTVGLNKEEVMQCYDLLGVEIANPKYEPGLPERIKARTHYLGNGWVHVELGKYKNDPEHIATLAHEILHAIEFKFEDINLPHTEDTSEAWAYTLDYFLGTALNALRDKETNFSNFVKVNSE